MKTRPTKIQYTRTSETASLAASATENVNLGGTNGLIRSAERLRLVIDGAAGQVSGVVQGSIDGVEWFDHLTIASTALINQLIDPIVWPYLRVVVTNEHGSAQIITVREILED